MAVYGLKLVRMSNLYGNINGKSKTIDQEWSHKHFFDRKRTLIVFGTFVKYCLRKKCFIHGRIIMVDLLKNCVSILYSKRPKFIQKVNGPHHAVCGPHLPMCAIISF